MLRGSLFLGHTVQTISTSLQTDNHTNTSSLNFYRPGALPDAQPTVSKHYRQSTMTSEQNVFCKALKHYIQAYMFNGPGRKNKQLF